MTPTPDHTESPVSDHRACDTDTCPKCDGFGFIGEYDAICDRCGGAGYETAPEPPPNTESPAPDFEYGRIGWVIQEEIAANVERAAAASHRPESVRRHWQDANARFLMAEALLAGPLDDLSVLVQIPKVRELVKALGACENPQHDWLLDQWEVWLWR